MTVAFRAILGAAGRDAGGGGTPTEYGIESFTTAGEQANLTNRVGWVFTVGASDIEVTALRHYSPGDAAGTYRVIVHRNSDDAVMATADIDVTATGAAWFEEAVTPVTLSSGVQYTISAVRTAGSVFGYRNPTGVTMASEIALDDNGVFGTGDTRPSGATSNDYRLYADFGFS